jgi:predicted lipoprotein with Yx(FWY)xxD motif
MRLRHIVLLVAAVVGATAGASSAAMGRGPAIELKDKQFGPILATPGHKALYYWSREKKDFKVRCTGACAKAWPPLVVRSANAVPKHVGGIMGTFGTVTRPDGKLQVTFNRLPVYTYAHEGPNQVLCDNVDGWFVVRV